MPQPVANGALLACTFGLAPGSLTVLPSSPASANEAPLATIMDNAPMVNVMSFGMCASPANPEVAAATAAALGVLTPMPCVPATAAPWTPGSPSVMISDQPALDSSCSLTCLWGGMISVSSPGQVNVSDG
jgi:hypothetical protein